ncbi:hypothetical protein [Nitrosomonas oligotropha]|uniref:hypothetical protein n=1 Tax=Nitrosomonas oligotropha TaxID=42354 RepID=UPI001369E547|nr:hypothetical protein [Nitrosomonas oligotropha]MXS81569.1 hypothetical protein [Nitrosomonas oligotropha]
MQNLLKECKVSRVANSAAAAQTEVLSSVLDMSGYDGVIFIALLGDVTVNSVLTLTAKGNTANSTSSPTPVTQKATDAYTAAASDADNKLLIVDVPKPQLRYIFASLTRTAANAVVDGIIAIQYQTRSKPVSLDATVLAAALGLGAAS